MFIPPGTPHIYRSDPDNPWSVFWIHFGGKQTELVLQSLGLNADKSLLYVPDIQMMRKAFENVYACLNYHYSDAGLLAMTAELMRLLSTIKLHQGHLLPQRQQAENRVVATLEFMEQHLDISLSLDELAAHAALSAPYFSKLFKARTNQSPTAYFIQLKIRKSCELLDFTDMTVQAVAQQLGYDDPYYFSRAFKRVMGMSPSKYRTDHPR